MQDSCRIVWFNFSFLLYSKCIECFSFQMLKNKIKNSYKKSAKKIQKPKSNYQIVNLEFIYQILKS